MNFDPRHLLRRCHMTVLKAMARHNDVAVQSRKKPDYVEALAESLFQGQAIAASLPKLSPAARQLLHRLTLVGGQAPTRWISRRLEEERILAAPADKGSHYRKGGNPGRRQSHHLEDVLAQLIAHGLTFSVDRDLQVSDVLDFVPKEMLIIPPTVLSHLPADPLVPPPSPTEPEAIQFISVTQAQRTAYLCWNYVRHHPIRLTSMGKLPEGYLRDVRQEMTFEDPPTQPEAHIFFLLCMMEEMGLLEEEEGCLKTTPDAESFFSQSPAQRAQSMLRAWVESSRWSFSQGDFWDQDSPRQGALTGLKEASDQSWVPLLEWAWCVRWNHHPLFVPQEEDLFLLEAQRLAEHARAPSQFLQDTLRGPFHWLGLVSISKEGEGASAFKLTSGATSILNFEEVDKEGSGGLVIQPDFHVLALPPVDDGDLALLDEIGQRIKADRVFEYRLTRSSVYTAQQRGRGAREIIDFLESRTRAALPQNVSRTLLEWERQHQRITFHRSAALCQVTESEILDELMAEPTIARWILRRLTPTEALLRDVKRFSVGLRERGHLATLTPQGEEGTRDSIIVEDDGHIRILAPVPNIHVLSRLSKFAHGQGADFRITENSIRKAIERGLKVTDILISLQAMNRGPLGEVLAARIRAWGQHLGETSLS